MGPLPDAVLARLQAMGEEGYTFSADRDQLARHYAIDGIGPSCYVTPGSAAEVAELLEAHLRPESDPESTPVDRRPLTECLSLRRS